MDIKEWKGDLSALTIENEEQYESNKDNKLCLLLTDYNHDVVLTDSMNHRGRTGFQ